MRPFLLYLCIVFKREFGLFQGGDWRSLVIINLRDYVE